MQEMTSKSIIIVVAVLNCSNALSHRSWQNICLTLCTCGLPESCDTPLDQACVSFQLPRRRVQQHGILHVRTVMHAQCVLEDYVRPVILIALQSSTHQMLNDYNGHKEQRNWRFMLHENQRKVTLCHRISRGCSWDTLTALRNCTKLAYAPLSQTR